jgi:hypothetical protein
MCNLKLICGCAGILIAICGILLGVTYVVDEPIVAAIVSNSTAIFVNMLRASEVYTASILTNHSAIIMMKDATDIVTQVMESALSVLVTSAYGGDMVDEQTIEVTNRARNIVLEFRMLQLNTSRLITIKESHIDAMMRDYPMIYRIISSGHISDSEEFYVRTKLENMRLQWKLIIGEFMQVANSFDSALFKAMALELDIESLLKTYSHRELQLIDGPSLSRMIFVGTAVVAGITVPAIALLHLSTATAVMMGLGCDSAIELYRKYIGDPEKIKQLQTLIVTFEAERVHASNFTDYIRRYANMLKNITTDMTVADIDIMSIDACTSRFSGSTASMAMTYCLKQFVEETVNSLGRVKTRLSGYNNALMYDLGITLPLSAS